MYMKQNFIEIRLLVFLFRFFNVFYIKIFNLIIQLEKEVFYYLKLGCDIDIFFFDIFGNNIVNYLINSFYKDVMFKFFNFIKYFKI